MDAPATVNPTAAAISLAQALRTSTRPVHQALEARLDLMGRPWDRDRYAAFLRATLAVVDALEAPIAARLTAQVPRWGTTRGARLRSDLAGLGAPAEPPRLVDPPAIESDADAFGSAYVLAGSELGARFIAADLERRLGLDDGVLAYLRPRTAQGPAWPEMVAALDAFGHAHEDARDRVVRAATAAFHAFERAFVREGFA